MREILNWVFWILFLGLLFGGLRITNNPEKTNAKYKIGDEIIFVIGSEEVDASIKSYISVKIAWFENTLKYEIYTIVYTDKTGVLHDHSGVKPHMIKPRKDKNPYNLYEYNSEN